MKRQEKLDKIEWVMRRVYASDSPVLLEALGYLNELRTSWWRRVLRR